MTLPADPERVLVLAPRGRDAELVSALMTDHGIGTAVCADTDTLLVELGRGAACLIVTLEGLTPPLQDALVGMLDKQPPWSDFPIIVLAGSREAARSKNLVERLGNVTVVERPISPQTLLAAVNAALRARRRQYEARVAIEQRDQFLAMLGHELRTPLGAIVLATELARSGNDRAQLETRLEVIARQSNLLARLVDDLLDVARVTTGKVRLRSEAVDVDSVVRGCIDAHAERARVRNITLVLTATSGAVIEGDTVRIEQVINNLLANAIKYSPSGRTVRVGATLHDRVCEIRVRDQGIGIAPDMQGRVFDLFAQVDGSIERADGGMGIGLTLVDRLVRLHGGTVEVISAGLGQGSEFIVRLPVGNPPGLGSVIELHGRRDGKVRVVLVEDNADLRDLTTQLLEALGCTVEVSVDGPDGVERIVQSLPDIAFVDIGLPLLDGFGVASAVRAAVGGAVMLVAVTGYGRGQERDRALAAGFDVFVTKPLGADSIRTLIERARARRPASRSA